MFTAGSYDRSDKAKTERQPGFLYLAVRQTESPLDGVRIYQRLFSVQPSLNQMCFGMIPLGCLLKPIETFTDQLTLMPYLARQPQPVAGLGVAKAS